ncbi:MAG TPA: 16S rRNA (uracil(1498)-N(3))-methyltransferase [Parvularculaceae bacterium]|nr:16S rRNA (uracil(1498)-N(3))-methyltransferase [Parvularculaceae bacterium]
MTPRLYHNARLAPNATAALTQKQAHYLRNVLRREAGAALFLFNAENGEYAARVVEIDKKGALVELLEQTRSPAPEPDIELLLAPVKRSAMEMIVQKGTELGVRRFRPVMTDRTSADRLRVDRLQAIALEAAEQCGRLSVPEVAEPAPLPETLLRWDASRALYFCDEAGDDPDQEWGGRDGRAAPMLDVVAASDQSAAILIGPEGGFSPDERKWLRAVPYVTAVTLGPRILRADTAAIVALALWQARAGDLANR